MKKAAVIGVYGEGPDFTTGQAVKCMELIRWLQKRYGTEQVQIVNSYRWKRHPVRLFLAVIRAFRTCGRVIIMPAPHGVKVFVPMSYHLKRLFHRQVHYVVIGGWLADMLAGRPKMRRYVSAFDGVYAETRSMVLDLQDLGLENVVYMPNFRKLEEIVPKNASRIPPVRVCTYSRVVKEKGIEDAVDIVRMANDKLGGSIFLLDIYGKVEKDFEAELAELVEKNKDFVQYCGVKNAEEGIKTLSPYFALLFPTYYEGEGLAGTVLDAFASETPVIANDWKYIREIITHEENGLIYPFRNLESAAEELCRLFSDEKLYLQIQNGCFFSARRYSTDIVLTKFAETVFGEKEAVPVDGSNGENG